MTLLRPPQADCGGQACRECAKGLRPFDKKKPPSLLRSWLYAADCGKTFTCLPHFLLPFKHYAAAEIAHMMSNPDGFSVGTMAYEIDDVMSPTEGVEHTQA